MEGDFFTSKITEKRFLLVQLTMETPDCIRWSELPMDMVISLFERLSFVDFHRAKMVCWTWYLCSKQTLPRRNVSPWLMLFPEDGCVLYNQEEDRVYRNKRDFSGIRFLANSGKWFLVVDSRANLYIVDVFSKKRIDLPPLESIKGGLYKVKRVGDNEFHAQGRLVVRGMPYVTVQGAENLRGVLWVDDKNGDYVVVWQFECSEHTGFCKKGDVHYREIPTRTDVRRELQGLCDMVLKGYSLYVLTIRGYIRHLDLSGQDGFKDVSENHLFPMRKPPPSRDEMERMRTYKLISYSEKIAVTTSGEVLLVHTNASESTFERHRMFYLYKRKPDDLDPNTYTKLVEVDSLGDEAMLLDLGITVPADHTLGIEPNSIYFSRDDWFPQKKNSCVDICVYNLATKTIKRFPSLPNLKLWDAHWFLPS